MAKKRSKGFLGLGQLISIIICIFVPVAWVLGIVERLLRGNIIGAILNIFFGWIFWLVDLITLILHKDITVLA